MKRLAGPVLVLAAALFVAGPLAAPVAEARGAGGRMGGFGGGGRRSSGGKDARWNAQNLLLISDCVRDDNVRRMRHVDW